MKIASYWILLLGQTIGDATILSHLIPLYRQFINSGLAEKTPTVLFLIFCYTLELERIGRALVEPKDRNSGVVDKGKKPLFSTLSQSFS